MQEAPSGLPHTTISIARVRRAGLLFQEEYFVLRVCCVVARYAELLITTDVDSPSNYSSDLSPEAIVMCLAMGIV
jgi:hypothetical protein